MENQKFELVEVSYGSLSGVRNKNLMTLDELIVGCYVEIFEERRCERSRQERIPKVKEVFLEVVRQFDKRGFEKSLGVGSEIITEECIAMFLIKNKYIATWGFAIIGDCQTEMFPDIMGDKTVLI